MTRTERIFHVEHVGFRITDDPKSWPWFAIFTGLDEKPTPKNTLFTGPVNPGMAAQLRELADYVETLEVKEDV